MYVYVCIYVCVCAEISFSNNHLAALPKKYNSICMYVIYVCHLCMYICLCVCDIETSKDIMFSNNHLAALPKQYNSICMYVIYVCICMYVYMCVWGNQFFEQPSGSSSKVYCIYIDLPKYSICMYVCNLCMYMYVCIYVCVRKSIFRTTAGSPFKKV